MALQGDLDSFALADVLRLLAGTTKTGRLAVSGSPSSGELWLVDGDLAGGVVSEAPHASTSEEVLFELMRLESGSFVFDDDQRQDGAAADHAKVDDAISGAEAQIAEWADVSAVVASMQASVQMIPELSGEGVMVTPDQWRMLAALGPATTVADLGTSFSLTDLVISRQVKDLVESGLAVLGEPVERATVEELAPVAEPDVAEYETFDPTVPFDSVIEDDSFDQFQPAEGELAEEALSNELSHAVDASTDSDVATSDLALLGASDGPVVLEHRDDAELPEPLPGAGTAFEGDLDGLGTVDGRSFESFEAPVAEEYATEHEADEDETASTDDARGSLMRFLSSVEP